MDMPAAQLGGLSQRRFYELQEERTGRTPAELSDAPQPPAPVRYLLEWFNDLNMDRQSSGFGPMSITSEGVLAWAKGKAIDLRPTEFDALRLLNRIWMNAWADANPSNTKGQES